MSNGLALALALILVLGGILLAVILWPGVAR
jgi:hypothetical protein